MPARQHRLGHLDVPVTELVPEEVVDRVRGLVEAERRERLVHLPRGVVDAREDPALHRLQVVALDLLGLAQRRVDVRQGEARRVPDLVRERGVALHAALGQRDVAIRSHDGQSEADRVRAVLLDHVQRIDDVPLRLRHLLPMLVAHESVQKDGVEGRAAGEAKAEHDHARHPEEEDVEAGDEDVGRIEDAIVGRVVRPPHRRERPEAGGEPGVEDVGLLLDLRRAADRARGRIALAHGHVAVVAVEGRDAVAPPELARDRPVVDVLHPVEVGRFPCLRQDLNRAVAHDVDGRFCERLDFHEPLPRDHRLDIGVAFAMHADRVRVVLRLLQQSFAL